VQARPRFRFVDPRRQGRFEALLRDLGALPLREATCAVAGGRVRLGGEPYRWEPEDMVSRVEPTAHDAQVIAAERGRCHFTVEPVLDPAQRRDG
jgi:hypothetical protein